MTDQIRPDRPARRTSTKNPITVTRVLGVVFGALGVSLLLVALILFLSGTVFSSKTAQVIGTVRALLHRYSGPGGGPVAPLVTYTVNSTKYTYRGEIYSSLPRYKVGDTVTIRYTPADPQDAEIAGDTVVQLLAMISAAIGAGFTIASAVMWLVHARLKSRRKG